jgi:hypothetical protein
MASPFELIALGIDHQKYNEDVGEESCGIEVHGRRDDSRAARIVGLDEDCG